MVDTLGADGIASVPVVDIELLGLILWGMELYLVVALIKKTGILFTIVSGRIYQNCLIGMTEAPIIK